MFLLWAWGSTDAVNEKDILQHSPETRGVRKMNLLQPENDEIVERKPVSSVLKTYCCGFHQNSKDELPLLFLHESYEKAINEWYFQVKRNYTANDGKLYQSSVSHGHHEVARKDLSIPYR